MPKVSIIMPAFNCEAYIEDAVRSVFGQTETDIELIVVNDGSTDNTLGIVNRLASIDSCVSVYSQPNSGKPAIARNRGLSYAKGNYISFLDSDDVYHPDKIKREIEVLESLPEIDLVFSDMKRFWLRPDEQNAKAYLEEVAFLRQATDYLTRVCGDVYVCRRDFYRFMSIQGTSISTQTVMFRRHLLESEATWFCEDMLIGEDIDLWFRLAKRSRVAFINAVLSYYRQREDSLTQSSEDMMIGTIAAHSTNLERGMDVLSKRDIRQYKRKISQELFNLGYLHFRRRSLEDARTAYRRSMALYPCAKTSIAYLKTFAPEWIVKMHQEGRLLHL